MTASRIVLEARGLVRAFGGVHAVDGLDLDLREGTITGLIGPNGAGKSTAFNLITGVIRAQAGTVRLNGEDISRLPSYRRARKGMIRTFQLAREFGRLTVLENLMLAPQMQLGERLGPIFRTPTRSARPIPASMPGPGRCWNYRASPRCVTNMPPISRAGRRSCWSWPAP
jgi:branched-chain amino acid transport system ATP-binding protein